MGPSDHPSYNVAQRLRLRPQEVEPTVTEVHELVARQGRSACTWEVGSSATPADLRDRLLALGLVPDREPHAVGMVMTEPPAEPPPGVEAHAIETFDEYVVARRIQEEVFELPAEHRADEAELRSDFEQADTARGRVFLALLEGQPAAAGTSGYSEAGVTLFGAATLPWARGHGAYRALVRARWDDAAARGTPTLVTQAGAMSRPILKRLGFRSVCEIWILLDEFSV